MPLFEADMPWACVLVKVLVFFIERRPSRAFSVVTWQQQKNDQQWWANKAPTYPKRVVTVFVAGKETRGGGGNHRRCSPYHDPCHCVHG